MPAGLRVARAIARMLAATYPAGFRQVYGAAFEDVAEDRWRRELDAHRSAARATLVTLRVLIADTATARRVLRATAAAQARTHWSTTMTDQLRQNIRLTFRQLARAPLVTVVGVASLAIGIGANTAVFTVANAVLFAPLTGVAEPGRVVDIGRTTNGGGFDTLSYPTYLDVRQGATSFDGMFAMRPEPQAVSVGAPDGAERAYALQVSASYFDVLGVRAAAGAFFRTGEERLGTPLRKVVLSHTYWHRRYQDDPRVVGSDVVVNGTHFTVAGVASPGFQGTTVLKPDLWVPLTAYAPATPTEQLLSGRENAWLVLGARLKAGRTIGQARAEVAGVMQRLSADYPNIYAVSGRVLGLTVLPVSRVPGEFGAFAVPFVAVLMGLVGLVLLVVCANLAGLLIARAASRAREVAVRRALGASRLSLVGMFLVDTVVLFLAGAGAGMIVARWATSLFSSLLTQTPLPIGADLTIDWRVLAFTAALTLGAALATGLAPAWQGSRSNLVPDLKSDASAPRRQRLRRIFVAAQTALCLLLMIVAGLLLRSLGSARHADPGFQVDGIDLAVLNLQLGGYAVDQSNTAIDTLQRRFAAVPGVEAVAVAAVMPLGGDGLGLGGLRRPGDPDSARLDSADWNVISPEFLPMLHLPIVRGRNFTAADRAGSIPVAVVNERLARDFWPGKDPIGQVLESGDFRPGHAKDLQRLTVVGVARDAKYRWIGDGPRQFIYVPIAQNPWRQPIFLLRRADRLDAAADLQPDVRRALRAFDRNLPLVGMMPFRQIADLSPLPQRIAGSVAAVLGGVALLLAAVGLYGVTAFAVASRTREIGVRMALGADHGGIRRLVLGQALRLVAIGGGLGIAAAALATQLLSSLLFGISPLDPIAFAGMTGALALVALAATYLPARRAMAVDPVSALRAD